MVDDKLIYRAPPASDTVRRVYVLPIDLVKRIHEYGYEAGHPSEVAAVRDLLDIAFRALSTDRGERDDG